MLFPTTFLELAVCPLHTHGAATMLYLSASLIANWNVTVGHTTRTSIIIHWQDLTPLITKRVLHYIGLIRNRNGSDVLNAVVVDGNKTYANIAGLSTYTEYQVSVVGVSSDGQPYQSSNFTAWTEEGGIAYFTSLFVVNNMREGLAIDEDKRSKNRPRTFDFRKRSMKF